MDPMKHDPPQALALHLIKGVFEDARLGPVAFASLPPPGSDDWFTAIVCRLALPNFTADEWTIANASLQLFGGLLFTMLPLRFYVYTLCDRRFSDLQTELLNSKAYYK